MISLGLNDTDNKEVIFKYRFMNSVLICSAIVALLDRLIFYLLDYDPILPFVIAILCLTVVGSVFQYFRKIHITVHLYLCASSVMIMILSIGYGVPMAVASFFMLMAIIVCITLQESKLRYLYYIGFLLTVLALNYRNSIYGSIYEINNEFALSMVLMPTVLFLQIILINAFSREQNRKNRKFDQQNQELKRLFSVTQSVLESTTDGILVVDLNQKITHYNQRFLQMWSVSEALMDKRNDDEWMGNILQQLKEPGKFISKVNDLYNQPEISSKDILHFKDGQIFERNAQPHLVDNEIVGRVWSYKDITDQENARIALEERENLFRKLYEYSPVGIIMGTHHGGKLTYANRKFCEMLGYTSDEIQDKTVSDVTYSVDRGLQREKYQKVLSGEIESFSLEKRYITKNGDILWGHVSVSVVRDSNHRIKHDIVIVQDITEKRKTEKALQESEIKFRNMFERAPFPLVLYRGDQILDCNDLMVRFLEADSKKDLLKIPLSQFAPLMQIDGRLSNEKRVEMEEIALKKGAHRFEWINQKIGGSEVPLNITITPFELKGEKIFFGIWRDMTEQKESESKIRSLLQELRRKNSGLEEKVRERTLNLQKTNEDLLRSNQDLEQFAYIASHDLQEPLRMVGNFVQLLNRQYSNQIDKDGKTYINFAVDGVTRMSKLIQNLLRYSRVGRTDATFVKVNLNDIIDQKILDLSERLRDQKGIVELQELPLDIQCEPEQLGIVFYNLIGNALKFNQSEQPEVIVTKEERENDFLFAVSDNGIGIDSQYSEKVFQIFKRLHRREEYAGTGIGLSLCKRIVSRHKGQIWFVSTPGEGTTFYFTIKKNL